MKGTVRSIYTVLHEQSRSDGEKLIAILQEFTRMKINVRNILFKKIRNAYIRAKIDSLMGGQPRQDINIIKSWLAGNAAFP